MKIIHCPLNGPRNAQEFICAGEIKQEPSQDAGIGAWADYVFLQDNTRGVVHEWWCHIPSNYWFIVTRDTATEEFLASNSPADFFARHGQGGDDE